MADPKRINALPNDDAPLTTDVIPIDSTTGGSTRSTSILSLVGAARPIAEELAAQTGTGDVETMPPERTAQAISAQVYPTRADLLGRDLPVIQTSVTTSGHTVPGVGGARHERRGSVPSHSCYFQTPDGSYFELAEPSAKPEMCGGTSGNALVDAQAMLDVLGYQNATGAEIVLRSGVSYKMGNARMQDWRNSRLRADGATRAILDFSDATDYATQPQDARVVVQGVPDEASTQALAADVLSMQAIPTISGTPPTYSSGTGLITFPCGMPHGLSTGQRVQVHYPSSDPGAGQRAYLTMAASDEGMALTPPVPITVVDSTTFTYSPPNGGTPAATMTLSGVMAYVSSHYVSVASTAAFAKNMLVELRSDRVFASLGGGAQTRKLGILRRIARVVSPTVLELDEGVGPRTPLLISENARIVPIPDAPEVYWERIGVKCRGYNPAGALGDSAATFLYCKPTLIDCGPIDNDYYGFSIFSCDRPRVERFSNIADKRNEGGAATGIHSDTYALAYGGSCRHITFVSCEMNGDRHGGAEGSVNQTYGQTENVTILDPLFTRQWSSNFATHYMIVGRLVIRGAKLEGGYGINPRAGDADIEVVSAIGSYYVIDAYGHIDNLKIRVSGAKNIIAEAVRLQPYAAGRTPCNVDVRLEVDGCRYGIYLHPQSGVKGGVFRLSADVKNCAFSPIYVTGQSSTNTDTWTEVVIGEVRGENWGMAAGSYMVDLVNCPRSSVIGPLSSRRAGSYGFLNHRGMTGDDLSIRADMHGVSTDGGTVSKASITVGTGHWAPGVVEAETCTVTANTITPMFRHDHRILIDSTGTHPLTIAGVGRGRLTLRPNTGSVTLQEGGNLQLDGSTDKVVGSRTPLIVEWMGSEFVQVAKQIS